MPSLFVVIRAYMRWLEQLVNGLEAATPESKNREKALIAGKIVILGHSKYLNL